MRDFFKYIFTYPYIPSFLQDNFKVFNAHSDKVMLVLLVIQWAIATFVTSIMYDTYMYGFFGGAIVVVPLIILYKYLKGSRYFRYFVAVAMMLFSMIYIQQYLGRIEMHFHIFIAMAILSLYLDIIPIVVAAVTTILHHLLFNYLQLYDVSLFDMPVMVFNYGCGLDIVFLHAIFVVIELLVIGYIIRLQIERTIKLHLIQDKVTKLNKELEHSSLHDSLTGLPNRMNLTQKMKSIKEISLKNNTKFAVIFLDLDHFKNINDTLGHDIGDLLLQEVSNIMKKSIKKYDIISRIGGDEFIIIISNFKSLEILKEITNKIVVEFRKELHIKGYNLRLSASIGVSIFPDDSTNTSDLMKYADIAMYESKENGRDNFNFFTQEISNDLHDDVELINSMQSALDNSEFELYYQPKIDINSNDIIGAEALIRWNHPTKGLISPNYFIHLAESTGFILNIGKFVIKDGISFIKELSQHGYNKLKISINVSTRQFQNSNLVEDIKEQIQKRDIDAKQLAVEITESIMMKQIEHSIDTLNELKESGITVYLDDFGTGYSSLSYLKKFPVDIVKIDKSFVDDIKEESKNDDILLNAILSMAHSLNLKVIAEGVEHKYQLDYLKNKNCDYVQGYYFGKPMRKKDFLEFCRNFKN